MNGVQSKSIKNTSCVEKSTTGKKITNLMEKSSSMSEKIRKEGNKLFGKKNHNKDQHKAILWAYSKSIAYAPEKSEQLASAYSNRSVLLMHIGHYKESIIDIDRALEIAKSEELLLKLVARRAKIMKSIEELMKSLDLEDSEYKKHNGPLSITKPSAIIPCASESVLLKYNQTFGRHFIADRDIKPGEVIIAEESYICIPKNNLRYIVCSHCLKFTWNGIPCESCPFVVYCSEDCKKEAWEEYHDFECCIFPHLDFLQIEINECVMPDVTIPLRIFLKAVKKEGVDAVLKEAETIDTEKDDGIKGLLSQGVLQNDKFKSCYNLSSNAQFDANIQKISALSIKRLVHLLLLKTNIFDEKNSKNEGQDTLNATLVTQLNAILNKIKNIVHVNSFKYQGTACECTNLDKQQCNCASYRGVLIAPCSSLINHSCCSNVSRIFLPKKRVVFFTITHVKKGEQLCVSYGPSIRLDKETRQKLLKQNFYFTCMCKACTENWPQHSKLELLITTIPSSIIYQIIYEFKKSYPKENESFIFKDPEEIWSLNEEGLEKAKLTSFLIYKYNDDYMKAFVLSNPYRFFIDTVLFNLYGEKCSMPDVCQD